MTEQLKCDQKPPCPEPAAFRMSWPGSAVRLICKPHAEKARAIAKVLGFAVTLEPVEAPPPEPEPAAKEDGVLWLLCIRADEPSAFHDNLLGVCYDCGADVQFRPYMPKHAIPLCFECLRKRLAGGEKIEMQDPSREQVRELRDLFLVEKATEKATKQ